MYVHLINSTRLNKILKSLFHFQKYIKVLIEKLSLETLCNKIRNLLNRNR